MTRHSEAFDRLDQADGRLDELVDRRSLCPDRRKATSLRALGGKLLTDTVPRAIGASLARSLGAAAMAQASSFPENLFWDFDYLAGALLRHAHPFDAQSAERVTKMGNAVVALHELFGGQKIRFRYAHDLVYGFDWAKWVARGPEERRGVSPFDLVFLQAMRARGLELVDLAGADDDAYPALDDGESRNPFSFSREPEHEGRLLLDLARSGDVPLEAWNVHVEPTWNRPYQKRRAERARELGIPRSTATHPIA